MAETELEQVQRHIAEGEVRILRQRALVAELKRDRRMGLAEEAERLLAQFLAIQAQHETHAKRLGQIR